MGAALDFYFFTVFLLTIAHSCYTMQLSRRIFLILYHRGALCQEYELRRTPPPIVLFFSVLFLLIVSPGAMAQTQKAPVKNHFPVPTKQNPGPNDYWFPIGWSIFLHDYLSDVPQPEYKKTVEDGDDWLDYLDEDWKAGTLSKIAGNSSDPWNMAYAMVRPTAGDTNARTTNSTHFVGFMQAARMSSNHLNVIPELLRKREHSSNPGWSMPAGINWPVSDWWDISDAKLRDSDTALGNAINAILTANPSVLSHLAGWNIADEPYGGEAAWNTSGIDPEVSYHGSAPSPYTWFWQDPSTSNWIDLVANDPFGDPFPWNLSGTPPSGGDNLNSLRDDVYYRLRYIQRQLKEVWDPGVNSDRLTYAVLRWAGNFNDPPTYAQNKTARVSDVVIDNHYLKIYPVSQNRERNSTIDAVENLLKPSVTPKPKAFFHFFDGWAWKENNDIARASTEELRHNVYTTLVQGAKGVGFWTLSKGEQVAFNRAKEIAQEVETMAPYLLKDHPSVFTGGNSVYMTSTGSMTNQDFIVRIHPSNPNKALILYANSSPYIYNVSFHFPSNWQIASVQPLQSVWSSSLANNILTIPTNSWRGRAFILTKS